jgi:hypothetical protein
LSVFAAGFLKQLAGRGYRPGTAAKQLQSMAHLSRWMAAQGLEPRELRWAEIERFVQERRASGRVQLASGRAPVRAGPSSYPPGGGGWHVPLLWSTVRPSSPTKRAV